MYIGTNSKEVPRSYERAFSPSVEVGHSHPKEVVIYDHTSYQLEMVRREIAELGEVKSQDIIVTSPAQNFSPQVDSLNRWKNVFNLRKLRMLN